MTQQELHRAIAEATGETITWVKSHGFSSLDCDADQSPASELQPSPTDSQAHFAEA